MHRNVAMQDISGVALTIAGGEIYVLNSADYGPVTINKAVTITSEGAMAGVLATSGAGITINAGANDVVNLRGLNIDGANAGAAAIQFNTDDILA
jgi:nitrous oxidase accessory protein NosD